MLNVMQTTRTEEIASGATRVPVLLQIYPNSVQSERSDTVCQEGATVRSRTYSSDIAARLGGAISARRVGRFVAVGAGENVAASGGVGDSRAGGGCVTGIGDGAPDRLQPSRRQMDTNPMARCSNTGGRA